MSPASPAPTTESAAWKALADPTRRRILDELRRAPRTTGGLVELFELSRFGVMKHLRVLHDAGLVLVERRGRERWNHLNPTPIREIYRRWIQPFEEEGADQLLALRRAVERSEQERARPADRSDAMSEIQDAKVAEVLMEVSIEAPIDRVWKALTDDLSTWWPTAFCTHKDTVAMRMEAKVGGRMYEDWGDGNGLLWGIVNAIHAPDFLQTVGDSSKEWGGPARNIITWRLEEKGAGTLLRLEHSLFGVFSEKTRRSLEGGWKLLFVDCMKTWLETGKVPDPSTLTPPEHPA